MGTFAFVTGYGCENGMDGGPPSPPRLKTQAMQLIRPDISGVVNQTQFGANYHVTAGQNAGGAASLCAGDSGGGVFAGPFNAGGNLVAINTSGIFGDPNGRSTRHTHARVDAPGVKQWILGITQPVGGTNGVDPNNPDFNYCNAAAQMCAIHQQREYFKLVTHCEQLGGQAPPCEFPDAATICMKADLACAQKNLSGWAALATQCQKLGGKTVQCGDSTWTL